MMHDESRIPAPLGRGVVKKSISLWQPWASLVACGAKVNETRPRPWAYKGDVAICSAKPCWKNDVPDYAIPALQWLWKFKDQFPGYYSNVHDLYMSLPFGAVLCVVEKTGCASTNDDNGYEHRSACLTSQELALGDYSADRFYYPTRNCRRLKTPVPVIGRQGFFNLPPDVEAAVRKQL
jgi:hypothetical protein